MKGPEWGWPLGYFLRAYFDFDIRVGAGKEVCCSLSSSLLTDGSTTEPYEDSVPSPWKLTDIKASYTNRSLARDTGVD